MKAERIPYNGYLITKRMEKGEGPPGEFPVFIVTKPPSALQIGEKKLSIEEAKAFIDSLIISLSPAHGPASSAPATQHDVVAGCAPATSSVSSRNMPPTTIPKAQ